ncbi:hypothetical protein MLD38_008894 [Melastoma candidum]|uniref:Uncharacterized protein n=1 Tax=Melastoma candidum TaxID=119954 RepID=A0ACB9RVG2_9MYRT|nr:hypothetical protein MLD38_008894 [Melastoma candidum]
MWRFKPFHHKEQTGLEGRTIDVGHLKVHVRGIIAEGGFSCVYLARDAVNLSKQYALKHIFCNDEESLQLVMKEISVMKSLRGHPNVVTLLDHGILDSGRSKEALLVMEFCEKSLVNVLDSRGAGYLEETQILSIFRDICNAVFAMHSLSPPIAHRDLKAENLLLGSNGKWKLCDFGSTSTNHKRFEKPEEMGIEEDNIRKHTTPAYRAPEMWDLFLKERISEKVDIWALGCLLFRICYLKSAFDGESKLQVLNGNYRIPELPKYSSSITNLIREMLQPSPEARPDITQIWFRVNEQLPTGQQKSLPDLPPEQQSIENPGGGIAKSGSKVSQVQVPHRSAPSPPSCSAPVKNSVPHKAGGQGQLGAFWSSEYAEKSAVSANDNSMKFEEDSFSLKNSQHNKGNEENHYVPKNSFPSKEVNMQNHPARRSVSGQSNQLPQDEAFQTFVAEFDNDKFGSVNFPKASQEASAAEVEKLKEQLKQADIEKAEMTSKYEKLAAICRSQRQEIQELKEALSIKNPSAKGTSLKNQSSARLHTQEVKGESTGMSQDNNSLGTGAEEWRAFREVTGPRQSLSKDNIAQSVRSRSDRPSQRNVSVSTSQDAWGFESENFIAIPTKAKAVDEGNISYCSVESKFGKDKSDPQPAGWSGF